MRTLQDLLIISQVGRCSMQQLMQEVMRHNEGTANMILRKSFCQFAMALLPCLVQHFPNMPSQSCSETWVAYHQHAYFASHSFSSGNEQLYHAKRTPLEQPAISVPVGHSHAFVRICRLNFEQIPSKHAWLFIASMQAGDGMNTFWKLLRPHLAIIQFARKK